MTVVGKAVVGRVRPALADAVPPYELSASFPSGHTLNSVAIAGVVAYLLVRRQQHAWSRIVTLACAAGFAVAMGLSRIYLGHHWLTDVLVAWALGLGWLTVVITAHRLLLTLRKNDSTTLPGTAVPRPDA
jgi:undecaprenyl-diphosphatase